ncbi:hypothetical protein [Rhodoferax mekongensis]|uniref:hypothetical protein n=1 Tax=Rhodoferax mekongensis TaxID=3068341 RepID=UPI0028BEC352|nr:hypothetical protein [Rhodoferax sp. TBRC 17199]MDT7514547.1 hypothetical protein [Rhodoferax sp. TBRC 17199]
MTEQEVKHFDKAPMHELLQVAAENSPRGLYARTVIQERKGKSMERIALYSAIAAGLSALTSLIQLFV